MQHQESRDHAQQPLPLSRDRRDLLALVAAGLQAGPRAPAPAGDAWERALPLAGPLLRPWLAWSLSADRLARPPERIGRSLQAAFRASAVLHLRRKPELAGILDAFRRREIPCVVLKGMDLAARFYPRPACRPMVDIDLAVPAERWEEARRAMEPLGLRVPSRHAHRPATGPHAMAEEDKPFQRPGTRILVDLHRGIDLGSHGRLQAAKELEQASRPADLGGVEARALDTEHLIVHACVHVAERHLFDKGLLPLLDLALVLRAGLERSVRQALRRRMQDPVRSRALLLPLGLAADLLGAPVPGGLLALSRGDAVMEQLRTLAVEQIFGAGTNTISPGLVEVAARSPRDRLGHVIRRLDPRRAGEADGGLARAGAAAARRLAADLAARVRIYAAAWRRGDLTREGLDHALELRRGRERLADLMGLTFDAATGHPVPKARADGEPR